MVAGFFLTVCSLVLPILLIVGGARDFRRTALSYLPMAAALQLGLFGILAGLTSLAIPYGWEKYLALTLLASLGTYGSLRIAWKHRVLVVNRGFQARGVALAALLAGVLLLDLGWIFARNGWSFDDAWGIRDHLTYFRPPLNVDGLRSVAVVNALARQESSPFLPDTAFAYQLFWFHVAAVFVSLTDGLSHFPAVCGAILGTGYLLALALLSALMHSRPGLFLRPRSALCLTAIVLLHADLFNWACSLFFRGHVGIEADGSFSPIAFHNFSFKCAIMTAPQHASFLLFALVFLLLRSSRRGLSPRVDRLARFASFAFGFLVSPILALLFFPALWGFDALRAKRWPSWLLGLEWVGGVALLCLGYLAIWKVSVPSLFLRPVTNHVRLLSIAYWELMLFPLVLVGMAGVLGLLTSLILVLRGRALRPRSRSEIGFLVSGAVTYFFFVSETELQRHFSILACLVMTFLLVRELPSYRVLKRSRAWSRTLGVMAVTGLALHGYFVFSFVGKPSVLSPAFAWEDYFEMNQLVLERFPRLPVLGATDGQRALYFPPVIEVATSYAGPLGAVIHSELGGEKLALLGESTRTGILPLAAKLGYRLVVWGPIEDWVWGKNAREILVGREPALLQRRSVSLYRIVESPGRGTR